MLFPRHCGLQRGGALSLSCCAVGPGFGGALGPASTAPRSSAPGDARLERGSCPPFGVRSTARGLFWKLRRRAGPARPIGAGKLTDRNRPSISRRAMSMMTSVSPARRHVLHGVHGRDRGHSAQTVSQCPPKEDWLLAARPRSRRNCRSCWGLVRLDDDFKMCRNVARRRAHRRWRAPRCLWRFEFVNIAGN